MIRIARGVEPQKLREARRQRLAQAFLDKRAGREVQFQGYDCARDPLYTAQGQKCAYCERQQGLEGQPVEHFRPKNGVTGRCAHSYYWLAWTWNNLLFACATCNSQFYKGNNFPLEEGTAPLPFPTVEEILRGQGPAFDVRTESRLLVDPSVDDPMDHIAWRPENPGDEPARQRWRPMHKTPRGEETIKILGLRSWLADQVSEYIRGHVWPRAKRVRARLDAGDVPGAVSEWEEDVRPNLFSELMPYHAASYDALDVFVPPRERAQHSLVLPRPGRHGTDPLPDIEDSARLALMPDDVRLEVRGAKKNVEEYVSMLCTYGSWTKEELAEAIECAIGTVSTACRNLIDQTRLERTAAGYVTKSP